MYIPLRPDSVYKFKVVLQWPKLTYCMSIYVANLIHCDS